MSTISVCEAQNDYISSTIKIINTVEREREEEELR